jgi:hypothetical protein
VPCTTTTSSTSSTTTTSTTSTITGVPEFPFGLALLFAFLVAALVVLRKRRFRSESQPFR